MPIPVKGIILDSFPKPSLLTIIISSVIDPIDEGAKVTKTTVDSSGFKVPEKSVSRTKSSLVFEISEISKFLEPVLLIKKELSLFRPINMGSKFKASGSTVISGVPITFNSNKAVLLFLSGALLETTSSSK